MSGFVICELCCEQIYKSDSCYNLLRCDFNGPTRYDLTYKNVKSKIFHVECIDKLIQSRDIKEEKKVVEKSDPMSILGI